MKFPAILILIVCLSAYFFVSPVHGETKGGLHSPVPQKYFGFPVSPLVQEGNQRGIEIERRHRRSLDDFHQNTTPVNIPDEGVVESVLNVPENVSISDINVRVWITHTWIRDLFITLRREGESDTVGVTLLNLYPGDYAVNMDSTWFDDEAGIGINLGQPPFAGLFCPLDTLAIYDGQSSQGNWILRVEDRFRIDSGRVEAWGLDFNHVDALSGTTHIQGSSTPASDVKVEVIGTPFQTLTDNSGEWILAYPLPGTYSILFSSSLYDSLQIDNVVIVEDQTTVIDTSLVTPFQILNVTSRGDSTAIPDTSGAIQTLTVAQSGLAFDVDVTVNINHPYTTDLQLSLIAPGGQSVMLVPQHCADDLGANFINCRFDDEAATPPGSAPYTGSWIPEEPLSELDSLSITGIWTLAVEDQCVGDEGTIINFTVHLVYIPTADVDDNPIELTRDFTFDGAYPNPFNSSTTFAFNLSRASHVDLILYDLLGREAATVFNGSLTIGRHEINFDATALTSGLYFAVLSSGHVSQIQKLVLLK